MPPKPALPRVLFYHERATALKAMTAARFPQLDIRLAPTDAALAAALPEAEILIGGKFPYPVMEHVEGLRWVQFTSSGVDTVLPLRHRLRDCVVTNSRGVHGDLMSDYVMAMVGAFQWDLRRLFAQQKARHWSQRPTTALSRRRMTVIGCGAIGRAIAARAVAAGIEVTGVARSAAPAAHGFSRIMPVSALHAALAEADFVVVVVPATKDTAGMIDAAAFAAMKPGARLINIARGDVVEEAALIAALGSGRLAGAALDVFRIEPLPQDNPLWDMPTVIATSHISGFADDYDARCAEILFANLDAYLAGQPLRNVVDLDTGY